MQGPGYVPCVRGASTGLHTDLASRFRTHPMLRSCSMVSSAWAVSTENEQGITTKFQKTPPKQLG